MRYLITAIGSMSAECVIEQLKSDGHFVVGCDIYPGEWHYETKLCDAFVRPPFATKEEEYIEFLVKVCKDFELSYLIPLTDLEIDVINKHRPLFEKAKITLCMQTEDVLSIARDKYALNNAFLGDGSVPSIKTCLLKEIPDDFPFPCIAKPFNGRSSEGLIRNATKEQVQAIDNKEDYIVQEQVAGNVFTVDYVRSSVSKKDASVPRQELLRTKNGAGLTVQTCGDLNLIELVSHIGQVLNINGCVNMEFIYSNGKYYLIDINPRFSAGVAFSVVSGYNMVKNHIRCFTGENIDDPIKVEERIIIKKYEEVFV